MNMLDYFDRKGLSSSKPCILISYDNKNRFQNVIFILRLQCKNTTDYMYASGNLLGCLEIAYCFMSIRLNEL